MDAELLRIFENSSSEKHYAPNTYSIVPSGKTDLNITSGQNANWTYANFFIENDTDKINTFRINEGQFVILKENEVWCLYDYCGNKVAEGLDAIEAIVSKIVEAESVRLKMLGASKDSDIQTTPLQQIFYGAPGTGKSHGISCLTNNVKSENVIRTTFHPDSDYSTFVGAYKPTMCEVPVVTLVGTQQVQVKDVNDKPVTERRIEYNFVPQAFTQAYIKAWKNLNEPVYLVIEEINRGNCAQIFGDIFQLLDRKDNGYSDYWITPDEELTKFLRSKFETEGIDSAAFDVIRSGEKMCLPKNLHIWATMNTSDQSLFPIDSAFKRRWDWKYVPINTEKEEWYISVNGTQYSWSDFLQKINFEIGDVTSSEDKKLGFYFCKAQDGEISAERFVSKVLFYIYNDVFKDYDFSREFFKHKEGDRKGKTIGFQEYFHTDGSINQDVVEELLNNLGFDSMLDYENEEHGTTAGQIRRNRFVIDGQSPMNMANTGEYIITKYLNENPGLSYAELRDRLPDSLTAGSGLPAVIRMQTDDLKSYERYYKNVDYITSDGVAIKILKQWNSPHFKNIVEFAKQLNWIVTELPSE